MRTVTVLQSKKRTKKLQRKELADYKKLVKLLDTNLGLLVERGLYWKRRVEEAERKLAHLAEEQVRAFKPSGLIYNPDGRLIT